MTNVIPDNIAHNSNKTIVFIESIKILSIIVIILTVVIKYKGILNKLQNLKTNEIIYNNPKNIKEVPPNQVIQNIGIPIKFRINPIIKRISNVIGVYFILTKNILYRFLFILSLAIIYLLFNFY